MQAGGRRIGAVERGLAALLVAASCAACTVTASDSRERSVGGGQAASATPTPTLSASSPKPSATRPTSTSAARPGTALAALAGLTVKGRGPMTGYSRAQFGGRWPDVDGNGCDTRNDVLRRDLTSIRFRPGSDCVVASGRLLDPYTGQVVDFVRGQATSAEVQIDHVVALGDAWQKGAARWTADKRERFANDPLNLLAVGGAVNQSKGDGDAATWLPPRTSYRCAYVARQVAVKQRYAVSITSAERDAMARVLARCPAQPLPR